MKMKTKLTCSQLGSVLMTSLLTITILTMICATSLYVTSQNGNATTQTTSWQQALSGAEAAVDQAINALNTNNTTTWSQWYTITSGSLPQTQPTPSGTPNATGMPGRGAGFAVLICCKQAVWGGSTYAEVLKVEDVDAL